MAGPDRHPRRLLGIMLLKVTLRPGDEAMRVIDIEDIHWTAGVHSFRLFILIHFGIFFNAT